MEYTHAPLLSPVRLTGLAAVASVLLAALLVAAPSANAEPATPSSVRGAEAQTPERANARLGCRVPRCYGAISVNPRTGDAVWGYNYGTKKRAVAAVQTKCKKRNPDARGACTRAVWVRNGCAAVAWRGRNGVLQEWAGRAAFTKSKAIRKARNAVRGPGRVKVWTWVCTSRR
ncbi:DUF4189 domain-containing protein [Nocardioides sambongensis]|uniref:DUF4189 domain-containing protein n=1 Tax=Nocardioides sambongensis TaxID=2589074 RepID=UPI0015E8665A|nr:DUF4189 domain-containing protein [Nocardioides sambongensis]